MERSALMDRKKCAVVVLETASSVRQLYMDALARCGFESTHAYADLATLEYDLQQKRIDWCLISLDALRQTNAADWIRDVYETAQNRNIAISVFYDSNDDESLPVLLETGILSYMSKAYSLEPLEDQFKDFLTFLNLYQGNEVLVSAEYVRTYLRTHKYFTSLLSFEESLLDLFPGHPRCLIRFAEALCLNQKPAPAAKALAQAEFIEPILKSSAQVIRQKYLRDYEEEDDGSENKNILGIKNCLIIDPDTDVQHYVTQTLNKIGITDCICFADGMQAFDYLKQNAEPKLILMEWHLPSLSGVALIQRIREHGFNNCFIVVISSLIKKNETPLLVEVGADGILEKPFDGPSLVKELMKIIQGSRNPTEKRSLERKIRVHLASARTGEAERLLGEYLLNPNFPDAAKLQLQAEYQYATQNYSQACEMAVQALKAAGFESVLLLSLLGKCFLQLRDFDSATTCFERAHKLSPTNVSRILTLINLKINHGEFSTADALIEQAKNVDQSHPEVKNTECRLALEKSDLASASKLLKVLDSVTGVVGMINNSAVAKIHAGRFEDGIKLYKDALRSLPLDSFEVKELVTYNLGLAYARYGELPKALETLQSQTINETSKLFAKFQSLKKRVSQVIEKGGKLELSEAGEAPVSPNFTEEESRHLSQTFTETTKNLEVSRGSRCCYKIYHRLEAGELGTESPFKNKIKKIL